MKCLHLARQAISELFEDFRGRNLTQADEFHYLRLSEFQLKEQRKPHIEPRSPLAVTHTKNPFVCDILLYHYRYQQYYL